ncbi:DUF5130 domain-containing protein [Jongsikchunia kroppenstedtii]|uniref:DUF5130 domain-containing protein n=1 Tax=Jongsikchunia kroppenstedtii TaxID=1121721 RepID=UPI00035C6B58|nr:DUF5130 domain-containing protein [Jongsikchunia kroppenstedtii]
MASGDHGGFSLPAHIDPNNLPLGTAITTSGRLSIARQPGADVTTPPFTTKELVALDETLSKASDEALVRFSIYIGDLGDDAVAGAEKVLPGVPEPEHAALLAVSPNSKDVVVVSGAKVADRVNDRVAQLGVTAAIAGFRSGDLVDGLVSGIRVMANAAKRS